MSIPKGRPDVTTAIGHAFTNGTEKDKWKFSLNMNLYSYIVYIVQFYSRYKNVVTKAHLPIAELLPGALEEDGVELGANSFVFNIL